MKSARTPAAMAQRVGLLEAKAAALGGDARQPEVAAAAEALFDALEQLYPADPWERGLPRLSTPEKIAAAAARAAAETIDTAEVDALRAVLPADALAIFGMHPVEALLACALVRPHP